MDYCVVYISCLDSHSDGTHSLQRIHWGTSDIMIHLSNSISYLKLYILPGEYIKKKNLNFFLGELFL